MKLNKTKSSKFQIVHVTDVKSPTRRPSTSINIQEMFQTKQRNMQDCVVKLKLKQVWNSVVWSKT